MQMRERGKERRSVLGSLDLSTRFRALTRLVCVCVCACALLVSNWTRCRVYGFSRQAFSIFRSPLLPPLFMPMQQVGRQLMQQLLLAVCFMVYAAWATSLVSTAINMRHMQHRNCNNSNLPPTRLTAFVDPLTGCKYFIFH